MAHSTFHFEFKDLDIDLNRIERILGYSEGDAREIVNAVIDEILSEPELFSDISAEYKIFDNIKLIDSDKSIEIRNVNLQIHKIIFGQIKKSDSIAVFLCTAGKQIGVRTRNAMSEGDPLTGYIYDIVGSIVVDAAAALMKQELEKSVLTAGKKITNFYSPGYCGWDVSEQHKLFRLMPDNYCRIRLTDSALMDPVKSISGIIGIGENVRFNPDTCRSCDMKDCAFRELSERKS